MMNDEIIHNQGVEASDFPSAIPSIEVNGKSDDEMIEETQDDREGCRSLICDSNGIIVAEMVYRCMICANVVESIAEAQKHYRIKHIGEEIAEPSSLSSASASTTTTTLSPPNKEGSKVSAPLALTMNGDGNQSDEAEDYSFTSQELPFLFNHNNINNYDYTSGFIGNFDDLDPTQFLSQTFQTEPTSKKSKTESNGTSSSRGGYVTCAVCNITKFYASVQRRYGQFTCMGCAKFFGRFLMKPRRYYCPNLGTCPLAQSPRCKACLLQACIRTYVIDDKRMKIVNANKPLKRMGPGGGSLPSDSQESPPPATALRTSKEANKKESSLLASPNLNEVSDGKSKSSPLSKDDKLNSPTVMKGNNSVINNTNGNRNSPKGSVDSTASVSSTPTPKKSNASNGTNPGRKVAGCRACSGCLAEDCGKCHYCLDKPKFGGGNTLKKKCIAKRCLMQGYKIKPSDNLKKIKISRK
uniref:Nuclear receptor domain-containing protein n=2 Tax=Tetranychus urticae TaxID=32264 RepID=T1K740_TETUR